MSKKDKIKEKIVSLRFWLGIVVATFLAIIGWSITNYNNNRILATILGVYGGYLFRNLSITTL